MTGPLVLAWLAITAPFAAALATLPPNGDSAWLLYVARALNRGERLGRDVLEINPPLVVWLKQPLVLVADTLGLPPGAVFLAAVALAILVSVLLVERLLRSAHPAWDARARCFLGAWLLFVLTFEGGISLGQRDHLAVVATLPYLVAVGLRWQGAALSRGVATVSGLLAGVGFALKPFFVPTFALAELALVLRRREGEAVMRAESVACALVLAAYAIAIPVAAPEWLASARVFWPLYDAYARLDPDQFLSWHAGRFVLAILATVALVARRRVDDGVGVPALGLLIGMLGFSLAFVLQRKGWSYLTVPVGTLALASLGMVAVRSGETRSPAARWGRAAVVSLLGVLAVGYVAWEVGRVRMLADYYGNPTRAHGAARRLFDERGTPASLVVLSTGHGLAFPLTLELGARWGMRLQSLWPLLTAHDLAAVARAGALPIATPRDPAHGADSLVLGMVAEDLARCTPAVILVAEPRDTLVPGAATHAFDYLRYLAADARLAHMLADYREVARIPDYRVLERLTAPACDAGAPPSSR